MSSVADRLVEIGRRLAGEVDALRFGPPVTHVYNPLDYARATYEAYVRRFAGPGRDAVLIGMNPGPWGMVQTGVPFGEIAAVRDWMGIDGTVGRPATEHPKRPVTGFRCARSEVSGRRVWAWARTVAGTAEAFFDRFFVLNYCPLVFMEASGRNRTPVQLPVAERRPLLQLCDAALRESLEALAPQRAVGIGRFARERLDVAAAGLGLPVAEMLHPSPASPAANRGWGEQVTRQLRDAGVDV